MIKLNDLEPKTYFTTNGTDIWEIGSYFAEPSLTVINLKSLEQRTFSISSFMAQDFHKIEMPVEKMQSSCEMIKNATEETINKAWIARLKRKDKK